MSDELSPTRKVKGVLFTQVGPSLEEFAIRGTLWHWEHIGHRLYRGPAFVFEGMSDPKQVVCFAQGYEEAIHDQAVLARQEGERQEEEAARGKIAGPPPERP